MPIYEFQCNKCGHTFEQLVFASDKEEDIACPACGKKEVCKLLSSFSCGSSGSGKGLGSTSCAAPSGGFS